MNVTKRIVNTKRHTIGFIIDGKRHTRGQAVRLAQRNKLNGFTVRKYGDGRYYIATKPSQDVARLYSLPVVVENK